MPRAAEHGPETRNAIAEAVRAGETDAAIAVRFRMTLSAVEGVIRRLRASGVDLPRREGNRLRAGLKKAEAAAIPKAETLAPRTRPQLREDQIADALAARLDTPAISAGSGGGGADAPAVTPPPVHDRVALSLMARGMSRADALHQARVHRAKMAEQVAARSARAVVSGQVSSHRPQNMPGASR